MEAEAIRILIIEDNPADVRLIQEMLGEIKAQTFQLEPAETLKAGIKRLSKGGIDLIILDLRLPDAEGEEVFKQVYPHASDLPIVVSTGTYDEERIALKLMQMGAQDYLYKGKVDSIKLARTLNYAIQRKKMLLQLQSFAKKSRQAQISAKVRIPQDQKFLILEEDEDFAQRLLSQLQGQGFAITAVDSIEGALLKLSKERPNFLILDLDPPNRADRISGLCRDLKKDSSFSSLQIIILTDAKDVARLVPIFELGIANFIFKPFENTELLSSLESLYRQRMQLKKMIDLNCIDSLIDKLSLAKRQDFFLLSPLIFNQLVLDKTKGVLGIPVLVSIMKRLEELVGDYYAFMKQVKFQQDRIFMDAVDRASQGVSVVRLAAGLRDYLYTFLQLLQTLTSDILMQWEGY